LSVQDSLVAKFNRATTPPLEDGFISGGLVKLPTSITLLMLITSPSIKIWGCLGQPLQ
jgi:hypothetical protein